MHSRTKRLILHLIDYFLPLCSLYMFTYFALFTNIN
nr:MAG TPA: hypothetical protein [Caudoviricetes sp.]